MNCNILFVVVWDVLVYFFCFYILLEFFIVSFQELLPIPYCRVLGVQLLAPQESVFHFVSPLLSTTPASTTTQNAESEILDTSDLSFSSDTQGQV